MEVAINSQYSQLTQFTTMEPPSQEQQRKIDAEWQQSELCQIETIQSSISEINRYFSLLIKPDRSYENMGLSQEQTQKQKQKQTMLKHKRLNQLFQLLRMFDETIENYNLQYVNYRRKQLYWFEVEILTISRKVNYFTQKITPKANRKDDGKYNGYFVNLVFTKSQQSYNAYRLHPQIFKQSGSQVTTTQILTSFEHSLIAYLIQNLMAEKLIVYRQGQKIVLKSRQTTILNQKNKLNTSNCNFNVISRIKELTQKFVESMDEILNREKTCWLCKCFFTFQASTRSMVVPTFEIIVKNRQKQDQTFIFHEKCALKFLRSPDIELNIVTTNLNRRMRPLQMKESLRQQKKQSSA